MNAEATKRLDGLLQDLKEIEEASSQRLRCAVITSTLSSPLHDQAEWQWIAKFVPKSRDHDGLIVLDPKPEVVEPSSSGTGCVTWYGHDTKREAFKAWVARLSGCFKSHPELVPDAEPHYGVEEGIKSLCAIATSEPKLSSAIKLKTILNLSKELDPFDKVPAKLDKIKPRPSFEVMEIDDSISLFSLKVLRHLLGRSLGDPPLSVDLENSHIVVRGKCFPVDLSIAHIIHQLVVANGNPISRQTMQERSHVLADEPRLDRVIAKIRDTLKISIESSKTGYWLSPEWLA